MKIVARLFNPHLLLSCLALSAIVSLTGLAVLAQTTPAPASKPSEVPITKDDTKDDTQSDLNDQSLEALTKVKVESVFSASKYLQKVTEAPASVSIITRADIQRYGYRTLAEALRSVRGFYVTFDRVTTVVGVRGLIPTSDDQNTRLLVLIDGHRINNSLNDGVLPGLGLPVDLDLVERIEVVRGPGSSLYGTNAFTAVVNLVTRRGPNVNGLEMSTEAASLGAYGARVTLGNKFKNGIEFLLSARLHSSVGHRQLFFPEFNNPLDNNGIAENSDSEHAQAIFTTISWRDFTVQGALSRRKKQFPTAAYNTVFNHAGTFYDDMRGYVDLRHSRVFQNEWTVSGRVYYDYVQYAGDFIYQDAPEEPLYANRDFQLGNGWGSEVQVSRKLFKKHLLTSGAEFRDNAAIHLVNYNAVPYERIFDLNPRQKNWALFLQDEFSLRESLKLIAGVRYDGYTTFGRTVNPRLALIYSPFAKTIIKALYGTAFRAPNPYELTYDVPGVLKANPNLRPEQMHSQELILEQYLGDRVRLSASLFLNRIDNTINQYPDQVDDIPIFTNGGQVRSRGADIEVEGKLRSGFEARASYSFQETANQLTHTWMPNSPRHLGKLNVSAPLYHKKLFAGLDLQYVSRRLTIKNLPGLDAPAFWLPNFTLSSRQLFKHFDFYFSLYNLANKHWAVPAGAELRQNLVLQDGLGYRLKLAYQF